MLILQAECENKKAVQGILKKQALGEMSPSNGCMSLLNLFWQCRTDLKAHVIIPLGIDISKQSRGSPGRKTWSKRDVAKIACYSALQTPAIALVLYGLPHLLRGLMKHENL